jgi:molecular chaperone HscB
VARVSASESGLFLKQTPLLQSTVRNITLNTAVSDFFAVLQLPVACEIDPAILERNYRSLQSQWHPDRFASGSQTERLAAVQRTSLLNDAYTTLKSPLLRAAHLLQLKGVDVTSVSQSQLAPAFLLKQMELRDELEELIGRSELTGLEQLGKRVQQDRQQLWLEFTALFDSGKLEQAQRNYYELQFTQRLLEETRAAEDRLLGY